MTHTPVEIEMAQQAFGKMKRSMHLKSIPIFLLILAFFGIRLFGEDHPYFRAVDGWIRNPDHKVALIGFALLFTSYILWIQLSWRCPHCKKSFGKQTNISHCMHCGIPLEPQ